DLCPPARELWSEGRARYSGAAACRDRSASTGMELAARQPGGLDQPRGDEHARPRTDIRPRIRRLGMAGICPDDTDADVRFAIVRGRCCRKPAVLCRDVRRAVPAAAVLASNARLRSARRRDAVAAVDVDAVPDRTDRGRGGPKIWRTAAGGDG